MFELLQRDSLLDNLKLHTLLFPTFLTVGDARHVVVIWPHHGERRRSPRHAPGRVRITFSLSRRPSLAGSCMTGQHLPRHRSGATLCRTVLCRKGRASDGRIMRHRARDGIAVCARRCNSCDHDAQRGRSRRNERRDSRCRAAGGRGGARAPCGCAGRGGRAWRSPGRAERFGKLDILIANAGAVSAFSPREVTIPPPRLSPVPVSHLFSFV
jgi:hypothetical protein